jgi:(S)-2-hydroxyglutarate dehydrogenase
MRFLKQKSRSYPPSVQQPARGQDFVVVGAGILGLATARELLRRRPGATVTVLEKEAEIAWHQTGHNSGVIHAGIYYKPGSLKAKLCVAGAAELIRYCDERGIPRQEPGKLIIATREDELPRLQDLFERGIANGVEGLRVIEKMELREIEPHSVGIRGLLSPHTGIVDYAKVADAYAADIRAAGGEILTGRAVTAIRRRAGRTLVSTNHGDFEASMLVACAGLYADRVAELSGASGSPRIVPFRGDYFILKPERRHLVRGNIYPVPDPKFPFLGVHFTPRMNGDFWLGPNAVLAFSREGYRFRDVRPRDLIDALTFGGFLKFGRKNWRVGYEEMARDLLKERFLASLQTYIPELTKDDLLPGPSGVRAQAIGSDGAMVDDFALDRGEGYLHVRNAPSPAATSSLQIGKHIVDALDQMLPPSSIR